MKQGIFKRAISGSFAGGLSFVFTLGTNLLQVTLLLRAWSQEQYGHWLLLLSTATLATALDGGHQLYIGNLLTREHVEDKRRMLDTLGSAVRVAAVLGGIQILLLTSMVVGGWIYPLVGLEPNAAPEFSVGLLIYTVLWIGSGSVGSVLVRLFSPTGHYVRSVWWNLIMRGAQFVALMITARLGCSLVVVATSYGAVSLMFAFAVFWDLRRLLPEFWPWWGSGSFRTGFQNFSRSTVFTVTSILDNLSQQGVVILVSHGLGTASVPLFTTIRTIANMAMQGGGFLLNPVTPDIVRFRVTGQHDKLIGLFQVYWLATSVVVGVGLLLLSFCVEPLYEFWTQGKLPFDRSLFSWMAVAVLLRSIGLPFGLLLQSMNRLRAQAFLSVLRILITFGGSVCLMGSMGLSGVALSLALAELMASLLVPAYLVNRDLCETGSLSQGLGLFLPGMSTSIVILFLVAMTDGWLALVVLALCILGLFACAFAQWNQIDVEFRQGLLAHLPSPVRHLLSCWLR